MNHFAIVTCAVFCALTAVRGQGLLDIGSVFEDGPRLPFSVNIASTAGWDSNPGAGSRSGTGAAPDESGSAYWENSILLHSPFRFGRNRVEVDLDYSNLWYLDPPAGTEEFVNNGSLGITYSRQINTRLSIGDSFHLSHQTEPDFAVGSSINRPNSGYYQGSNRLWANYRWTTRLSIVSTYTASLISYDEEDLQSENYHRHEVSEQLRYALSARTTGTLSYRFSSTHYQDNPDGNSRSHYILLGADRPLGRFLSMSMSGGAEFRSYDGPLGSRTSPYGEAAINYLARENTTFRLYFRSGIEDTGTAGQESSQSRRFGLAMTHRFSRGLSLNVSLNSVNYSSSEGTATVSNGQEDTFQASMGLNYSRHLWRLLYLNAGYTYSMVSSDDPLSDYERHRASLGVSCNF